MAKEKKIKPMVTSCEDFYCILCIYLWEERQTETAKVLPKYDIENHILTLYVIVYYNNISAYSNNNNNNV